MGWAPSWSSAKSRPLLLLLPGSALAPRYRVEESRVLDLRCGRTPPPHSPGAPFSLTRGKARPRAGPRTLSGVHDQHVL